MRYPFGGATGEESTTVDLPAGAGDKKNIGYPTDGSWVREEVPVGDP